MLFFLQRIWHGLTGRHFPDRNNLEYGGVNFATCRVCRLPLLKVGKTWVAGR